MSDLSKRVEALLDKYRRDKGGHYDSTLLRAQDGADLAKALRVLLAEAREEGKPLEKSEGQKATEWSQRPTREWEPPASAGTEEPGLRDAMEKLAKSYCDEAVRYRAAEIEPQIYLEEAASDIRAQIALARTPPPAERDFGRPWRV